MKPTLTTEQMNKILEHIKEYYNLFYDEPIIEENYVFLPELEFRRDKNGNWTPVW